MVSRLLGVWMNGEHVGHWSVAGNAHTFRYAEDWLRSPRRRSLSLSLPITGTRRIDGDAVAHFFENLLPDNPVIRERLQRRFGTRDTQYSRERR